MSKAEYIDHMGTDITVVNAARVSFAKESEFDYSQEVPSLVEQDKRLITYLAKHGHWTPFAHPQITLRETLPIFIARQRWKHEVGFGYSPQTPSGIDGWMEGMEINEVSRRYVDDAPEFYTPEVWRSRPDGRIKQGSGGTHPDSAMFSSIYAEHIKNVTAIYENMIACGVAPEQARMVLPQSMYTSYYVTGSLAAWARAYKQRKDSHAQLEIQDLAKQWDAIIRPLFPASWAALTDS